MALTNKESIKVNVSYHSLFMVFVCACSNNRAKYVSESICIPYHY